MDKEVRFAELGNSSSTYILQKTTHHFHKMPATSIPPAFVLKKQTILQSLATPADEYTDLSPKGSVDAGIKDLIDKINRLEGVVTTSSCAGRISVFLEGNKTVYNTSNDDIHEEDGTDGSASVPGGKGRGGRWLFVSHDPVEVPSKQGEGDMPLMRLCGLSRGRCSRSHVDVSRTRFVRLQFEPMVSGGNQGDQSKGEQHRIVNSPRRYCIS